MQWQHPIHSPSSCSNLFGIPLPPCHVVIAFSLTASHGSDRTRNRTKASSTIMMYRVADVSDAFRVSRSGASCGSPSAQPRLSVGAGRWGSSETEKETPEWFILQTSDPICRNSEEFFFCKTVMRPSDTYEEIHALEGVDWWPVMWS